jgi:HK97 family phage prohead protease
MNIKLKSAAAPLMHNGPPPAPEPELRSKLQEALEEEEGGLVTRADALVVKAIRQETREVDFVASTDTIDSHYEIIDQSTWNLSHYQGNPVVLYGHQAYDLPIGQCTFVAVQAGQLVCTVKFSDKTQRAREVFDLVAEKTLRAVSVGFRPVDGSYEMRNGEEIWVWKNPILKEISVVAIGSNPEALAKMKSAIADQNRKKNPVAGAPANAQPQQEKSGAAGTKGSESMKTAEQLAKELEEKTAAHAEVAKRLGELNVKLVEAETRAEKSEAGKTVAEKLLADAGERVKTLEAAARTLEAEHTKACADRDANAKRADDAEAKLIELEVDALVGKKISKADVPEFVELRRSNPALFTKMVAKRPDMKLTERVTEDDSKTEAKGATTMNGSANPGADGAAAFNDL